MPPQFFNTIAHPKTAVPAVDEKREKKEVTLTSLTRNQARRLTVNISLNWANISLTGVTPRRVTGAAPSGKARPRTHSMPGSFRHVTQAHQIAQCTLFPQPRDQAANSRLPAESFNAVYIHRHQSARGSGQFFSPRLPRALFGTSCPPAVRRTSGSSRRGSAARPRHACPRRRAPRRTP